MGKVQDRRRARDRAMLFAVVAGTMVGSLFPFTPDPPRRLPNHGARQGRELLFPAAGIAPVPALTGAALLEAMKSGPVHVDLTLRGVSGQDGPARILSLSDGIRAQNLMVGQSGSALVVRVRRTGTSSLGVPGLEADGVFDGQIHEIRVSMAGGLVTVAVDGRQATDHHRNPQARLADWDASHQLVLGNEHGGTRPWIGEVSGATLTTSTGTVDLVGASTLPETYWREPDGWTAETTWYDPWHPTLSQVAHAVSFFALGWLAAGALGTSRLRRVAVACVSYAALLLAAKFLIEGRHPSLADLVVQAAAALAGLALARSSRLPGLSRRSAVRTVGQSCHARSS